MNLVFAHICFRGNPILDVGTAMGPLDVADALSITLVCATLGSSRVAVFGALAPLNIFVCLHDDILHPARPFLMILFLL